MRVLSLLISSIFLAAAASSLVSLSASNALGSAQRMTEVVLSTTTGGGSTLLKRERSLELGAYREATQRAGVSITAFERLARLQYSRALQVEAPEERLGLLCESLGSYRRALLRQPSNARNLLAFANVRQILGSTSCEELAARGTVLNSEPGAVEPDSAVGFEEVVNFALRRDPTDPQVMYASGVLYLYAGQRQRALELFNQMLTFAISVSPARERVMLGAVQSPEDLEVLLPGRFPQVARWSRILKERDFERFRSFGAVLTRLQKNAIALSAEEYQRGAIDTALHNQRLESLRGVILDPTVRQLVDMQRSGCAARAGNRFLAEYLGGRARLTSVPAVVATLPSDTRPRKNSLTGWGRREPVVFDEFYRSVGAFVPSGARVELIELSSGRRGSVDELSNNVRVFSSEDNQNWQEIATDQRVRAYHDQGRPLLAIQIPESSREARFWKIHFASSLRLGRMSDELPMMLSLFGNVDNMSVLSRAWKGGQ